MNDRDDDFSRPLPPAVLQAVPATAVPDRMEVCHRHRFALTSDAAVTPQTKLIPVEDCNAAIAEVDQFLQPIPIAKATDIAELIVGSYPNARVNNPKIYIRALTSILAELPLDLAHRTMDIATRTLRWPPSRADLHQIASALLQHRQHMRTTAKLHIAERERRIAEAMKEKPRRYADLSPEDQRKHDDLMASALTRLAEAGQKMRVNSDDARS